MDFGFVFMGDVHIHGDVKYAEDHGFSHAWIYDTQMLGSEVYAALALCAETGAEETAFRATSLSTVAQMAAGGSGLTLLPEMAVALTDNQAATKTLWEIYDVKLREARTIDAQEGRPRDFEAYDWLDARY